jgi:hypothetical protein
VRLGAKHINSFADLGLNVGRDIDHTAVTHVALDFFDRYLDS